jgi:hypothetical protein
VSGATEFVRFMALVYNITGLCTACKGFLFQTRQLLFSDRTVTSSNTTVASLRDLFLDLLDSYLRLLQLLSTLSEYLAYSFAERAGAHLTQHNRQQDLES